MFACIVLSPGDSHPPDVSAALTALARDFSPRVERAGPARVIVDVAGLNRLFGHARALGTAIRDAGATRGLPVRVALAGTRAAAELAAAGGDGLIVVPPGAERRQLARFPLGVLSKIEPDEGARETLDLLGRWGLRTLGDLAALPAADLFERLGAQGLRLQRLARGEDDRPLVPEGDEEPFEASMPLDWPLDTLEPLAFIVARLVDPLCARLERADAGAVRLVVRLRLTTRATDERQLSLPVPSRSPRLLRTLVLLDLEARPPAAAIDAMAIRLETARARILQGSLLDRPLPAPDELSTLVARVSALVGRDRCGAPALVDSHEPGAFVMTAFSPDERLRPARGAGGERGEAARPSAWGWGPTRMKEGPRIPDADRRAEALRHRSPAPAPSAPPSPRLRRGLAPGFRRFRPPRPADVRVDRGQPAYVSFAAPIPGRGPVVACAGPWRSSGGWWMGRPSRQSAARGGGWSREEWDVGLRDGAVYRLYREPDTGRWFVEGVVD